MYIFNLFGRQSERGAAELLVTFVVLSFEGDCHIGSVLHGELFEDVVSFFWFEILNLSNDNTAHAIELLFSCCHLEDVVQFDIVWTGFIVFLRR